MTETLTRPQTDNFAAVQREVTSLLHAVKSGAEPLDIEDQGLVFDVRDQLCAALSHSPALADKIADLLETFAQSQSTLGVYARVFVSRHTCTLPDFDPSRVHIFDGLSKQGDDFSAVVWHRTIMGDRTSRVNQTDLTTYLAQANRYQLLLYVGTNKDMSLRATELAYNMAYDSPMPDTAADHVPDIKPAVFEAVKALHTLQKIPVDRDIRAKIIHTLQRTPVFAAPHAQKTQAPVALPKLRLHMAAAVTRTPTHPVTKIHVPALVRLKAPTKTQPIKQRPAARAAFKQAAKPNPTRPLQRLNVPTLAQLKTPAKIKPAKQQPAARAAFKQAAKPNPTRPLQRLNVPTLAQLKTPAKIKPAKQQPAARAAFKQAAKPTPARIIQRLNAPTLAHLRPKPSLRQVMQRAATPLSASRLPRTNIHARIASTVWPRIIQRATSARAVFQRASVMRNGRIIPKVFAPTLTHLRASVRGETRTIVSSSLTTLMHHVAVNTTVGRRPEILNTPVFKRVPQPRWQVPPRRIPQQEATAPLPKQPVRAVSEPAQKVLKQPKPELVSPNPPKFIPTIDQKTPPNEPLQFVSNPQRERTPPPQTEAPAKQPPQRSPDQAEPAKPEQPDRPTTPPKDTPISKPINDPIAKPIPILDWVIGFFKHENQANITDAPTKNKPIRVDDKTPPTPEPRTPDAPRTLAEPKIETPPPSPPSNEHGPRPELEPKPPIQLDKKGDVKDCCKEKFKEVAEDAVARAAAEMAAQRAASVSEPTHAGNPIGTPEVQVTYTPKGVALTNKETGETKIITHAELERNEKDHANLTKKLENKKFNPTNPSRPTP